MKVSTHTILALIAYFLIQPFSGIQTALLFALSSVLIDVDHWFWAIYKAKKWWLHEAYFWTLKDIERMKEYEAKGRMPNQVLHVFHTAEFTTLLLAASFLLPVLWPVFFGMAFHITCDMLEMIVTKTTHRRKWVLLRR